MQALARFQLLRPDEAVQYLHQVGEEVDVDRVRELGQAAQHGRHQRRLGRHLSDVKTKKNNVKHFQADLQVR